MIYNSAEYAKQALDNAEAVGNKMDEFGKIVDPIISQMCQMLMQHKSRFSKSYNKQLSEEVIYYLHCSGIQTRRVLVFDPDEEHYEYVFSKRSVEL